ncbi:hypothetical protein AB0D38_01785 [Streptomyces sp. NPDC048279]|uniref:hypothetical protein n=1 Tax=unclassified Streptomyces TaxID=2593676 RepID=UPI003421BBA4
MEPGTLFYDTATDQVGEYRDQLGPYAMLRPVGGGREWQADPAVLRPATDRERLSAGVRAANDRSTWCVPSSPDDLSRPPRPVPGCAECADLVGSRETALVVYDHSAATDANVLLRQHQRAEHQP